MSLPVFSARNIFLGCFWLLAILGYGLQSRVAWFFAGLALGCAACAQILDYLHDAEVIIAQQHLLIEHQDKIIKGD